MTQKAGERHHWTAAAMYWAGLHFCKKGDWDAAKVLAASPRLCMLHAELLVHAGGRRHAMCIVLLHY